MRDQKNPGREWPGEESEPREIVTPPAARDQAEASPQPVSFDDTSAESVVQIAGVDRIAESESDGGVEESLGAPVIVRAGIYARTATPKSAGEDGSLDIQVARCLQYAAEHHWDVSPEHIWRVVGSGNDPRLVGRVQLMEAIGAGELDLVLVCGVDRLARCLAQLILIARTMKDEGVHVVDVGEGVGKHLGTSAEVATALLDEYLALLRGQ